MKTKSFNNPHFAGTAEARLNMGGGAANTSDAFDGAETTSPRHSMINPTITKEESHG